MISRGYDSQSFRARLAVALACEVLFLAGRYVLSTVIEDALHAEIARTAWRLLFVVVYISLFFDLVTRRDRRPLPRDTLLIGSIVISVATLPLVHHGAPFDWRWAALDLVAIPIVAMREELFYRAILQSALDMALHPISAVLVAAILFTLSHVGTQPFNLATISSFLAAGMVLGVVYQHTRNLWIVVALHAFADALIWLPYTSPLAPSIGFLGNLIALFGVLTWWSLDRTRRQMEGR